MGRFDAFKRQEREALKRLRELERRAKEHAKLSALEEARSQVAENENAVALLLTVHKEQVPEVDWPRLASSLAPHRPIRQARHELAAHFRFASSLEHIEPSKRQMVLDDARAADEHDDKTALAKHEQNIEAWKWLNDISRRVLMGDATAYEHVIAELSPASELSGLGCSATIAVHSPTIAACELRVRGRDVVPDELKSLTSTGKLSVKAMPRVRFHEIYQDYVCGCALRVARELFAILPFETVLVTVHVGRNDASDGAGLTVPVLSVALTRDGCAKLNFESLDPSDTIETFAHRGDVKASKRSGEFVAITPLLPSDVAPAKSGSIDIASVRSNVRLLRASVRNLLGLPPVKDPPSDVSSGASL